MEQEIKLAFCVAINRAIIDSLEKATLITRNQNNNMKYIYSFQRNEAMFHYIKQLHELGIPYNSELRQTKWKL